MTVNRHAGTGAHGSAPFQVTLTDKARTELIVPLFDALDRQIGIELRPLLQKSIAEILEDVKSQDQYVKGLALEALAIHLMRLIDLKYVATRLRGAATGGAEVDLIFECARLLFSRWQVHCKNSDTVSLDEVAKEVGLTFQLKSNVVMVVSTGDFSSDVRQYAQVVMQTSNIDIVLLDSHDLTRIAENPTSIGEILNREAKRAMSIKRLQQ
jgi:site-specific DNA-methyltransferase (cytosine-N4-specific)